MDLRTTEQLRAIFDAAWYLEKYADLGAMDHDPLTHYILHGAAEGRDPNPFFDGAWYNARYPDVAATGHPALLHYLTWGARELRNPHPRFDAVYYAETHPEAAANPLLYHIRVGASRGWATEKPIDIRDFLPSKAMAASCPDGIAVDVVVAAYRGLRETQDCLESVLADPDRPPGRVIVVEDCSPEPKLVAWLRMLVNSGGITLLRNARNIGFVGSVNRGMEAAGTHDVALLNSDTVVPPGWLRRLAAQAYAVPRVASVSPFSNNATICGYPSVSGVSPAFGLDVHAIDAACRKVNAGRGVEVPTTVGFCMYIRRAALNDVGLFDRETFGRGYGEENDFCLRATARGWRHMLACDTYVFHEGNISFGPAAAQWKRRSLDALVARYPDYLSVIDRHVRRDAAGPARFAITAALLRASRKPSVLMISHQLGGGVQRHIDDLVARLGESVNVLLLSASARGVALSVPALPGHSVCALPGDRLDDLAAYLRTTNLQRVHVHHVAWLDLDPSRAGGASGPWLRPDGARLFRHLPADEPAAEPESAVLRRARPRDLQCLHRAAAQSRRARYSVLAAWARQPAAGSRARAVPQRGCACPAGPPRPGGQRRAGAARGGDREGVDRRPTAAVRRQAIADRGARRAGGTQGRDQCRHVGRGRARQQGLAPPDRPCRA